MTQNSRFSSAARAAVGLALVVLVAAPGLVPAATETSARTETIGSAGQPNLGAGASSPRPPALASLGLAHGGEDSRENESLKLARGQPNLGAGASSPRPPALASLGLAGEPAACVLLNLRWDAASIRATGVYPVPGAPKLDRSPPVEFTDFYCLCDKAGQTLTGEGFRIPDWLHYDSMTKDGKLTGGVVKLTAGHFSLRVARPAAAAKVRFLRFDTKVGKAAALRAKAGDAGVSLVGEVSLTP